ncbi:MAG: hypothetical protein SGILL_006380, partial [Bacillariaceae sp.]
YKLGMEACRQAVRHEINLILVDASPSDQVKEGLQAIAGGESSSGFVTVMKQQSKGRKGAALRDGIRKALDMLENDNEETATRDFASVIMFQELEKVDMFRHWKAIFQHMMDDDIDVCVVRRREEEFKRSYPIEQFHSEMFANYMLDSVGAPLTLPSIDWTSGPIAFRSSQANHWLDYFDGDLWDAQLVPLVNAHLKGAKVTSFEIDYVHPKEMKAMEHGSSEWNMKRLYQMNVLRDTVGERMVQADSMKDKEDAAKKVVSPSPTSTSIHSTQRRPTKNLNKKEAVNLLTELLTFPYNNNIESKSGGKRNKTNNHEEHRPSKNNVEVELDKEELVFVDDDNAREGIVEEIAGLKDGISGETGATASDMDDDNNNSSDNPSLLDRLLPKVTGGGGGDACIQDRPINVGQEISNKEEQEDEARDLPPPLPPPPTKQQQQANPTQKFAARRVTSTDLAHHFETYSFPKPTYCNICDGLLVGLWRQGMHCKVCGFDVHHGEGKNGHDDCKGEALLKACPGPTNDKSSNSSSTRTAQASRPQFISNWQQIQELFMTHPNLWEEFTEQTEKDFMKYVTEQIVREGAEGERSRNILRIREWYLLPFLQRLKAVEVISIPFFPILWLLYYHSIFLVSVGTVTATLFGAALLPTSHGITVDGVLIYTATITLSIQVGLLGVAVALRYLAILFKKKQQIVENFLQEMATISPQQDLGVSMEELAAVTRRWSDRLVVSNFVVCSVTVLCWYHAERAFSMATIVNHEARTTIAQVCSVPPVTKG